MEKRVRATTTTYTPTVRDVFGLPVIDGEWYWATKDFKLLGAGRFRTSQEFILCSMLVPTAGMEFHPAVLPPTFQETKP